MATKRALVLSNGRQSELATTDSLAVAPTANAYPGGILSLDTGLNPQWFTPSNSIVYPMTGWPGQGQLFTTGTAASAQGAGSDVGTIISTELFTGTTTTGAAAWTARGGSAGSTRGTIFASNFTALQFEMQIRIPTLSNGTDTFTVQFGIMQNVAINVISGYGLFANIDTNVLSFVSRNNSVNTVATNTFTVVANTIYRLRLLWFPATSTAYLYVNNTEMASFLGTVTFTGGSLTAIPTEPIIKNFKSVGTTSRGIYVGVGQFTAFF